MLRLAVFASAALLAASAFAAGAATPGNPVRGKALFVRSGIFCGSCHTLKAARSTGRDGRSLDRSKPSYATIVEAVTKGRSASKRWPSGMPAYSGPHAQITKAEIRDIAAFVYGATH
jgi:mono/diheme cytochrome c family protein